MLNTRQRTFLKALAHDVKPVILLGHKGITESVVKETKGALLAHELIKVRLYDEDALDDEATAIAKQAGAELVERIGKMAVLFKAHPDDPRIQLPRASGKNATPKRERQSLPSTTASTKGPAKASMGKAPATPRTTISERARAALTTPRKKGPARPTSPGTSSRRPSSR